MTAPVPTPEDIKAQYGFVALLAQSVPEIGALMQRAVAEKWTSERFQMAVAATSWWQSTPQQARQWITQQIADPASAQRNLLTGGDQITQTALALGFQSVPPEVAQRIWLDGQLRGYDEAMMKTWTWNAIFKHGYAGPGIPVVSGEAGARISDAQQLAASYGFNPADLWDQIVDAVGASFSASQDRATGVVAWHDKLKSYAKSKYSAFADRIDQGETVMDIARPYLEVYANTLELNQQDIGLDDRYVQQWLQGRSEAGKPPAAVPVWQAQQDLRKDSRWGYTNNARDAAAETATAIGKMFGMVG